MKYLKVLKWESGELYFMDDVLSGWKHYSTHPLKKPDLPEHRASKGYPTMQALLSAGYTYASSSSD